MSHCLLRTGIIKQVRLSLAKSKTRASSRPLSAAGFKTTASSQKAVRQNSLAQLPQHQLGDSTLSLLSLSSLSAKWECPPAALHHTPCHENTTERKDPKFESHHYRGEKKCSKKKKWSGGEGDSQLPQSTNTHPEKPAPSQELMMRTGPVASREAFERPPWQGWELSPTNSALGSGYGPSPTVRPPSACPQAPGHHHCPSVQALGPLQARS